MARITFYRWDREYGKLRVEEVRRLEERERENDYIESFNGKFREEFLNRELWDTLLEDRVLRPRCRREDHLFHPHRFLNCRPPAPEAFDPLLVDPGPLHPRYLKPQELCKIPGATKEGGRSAKIREGRMFPGRVLT